MTTTTLPRAGLRATRNLAGERRIEEESDWLNFYLFTSPPEVGLRDLIATVATEQPPAPPRLYQSHYHLLLERGRYWRGSDAVSYGDLPAEHKQQKARGFPFPLPPRREMDCYDSAVELASRRCGYEYVEGWALTTVTLEDGRRQRVIAHHGWNYRPSDGLVVEGIWPEIADEYLGIVFPFEYVLEALTKTGWFGILGNDQENGSDLLTRGLLGVDYVSKLG